MEDVKSHSKETKVTEVRTFDDNGRLIYYCFLKFLLHPRYWKEEVSRPPRGVGAAFKCRCKNYAGSYFC